VEVLLLRFDDCRAYQAAIIDKHIQAGLGTEGFERMVADKAQELKRTVGSLKPETIRQVSIATVRGTLLKNLAHVSVDEFSARRKAA
jgi:hypothetical protein